MREDQNILEGGVRRNNVQSPLMGWQLEISIKEQDDSAFCNVEVYWIFKYSFGTGLAQNRIILYIPVLVFSFTMLSFLCHPYQKPGYNHTCPS